MPSEIEQTTVRFTVTNGGVDAGGKGTYFIYPVGQKTKEIGHADSGYAAHLPAGTYDVKAVYRDGTVKKEVWLTKQELRGEVDQSIEMNVTAAEIVVHVTRLGQPSQAAGCAVYPAGQRSEMTARLNPEETGRIAEGLYDVGCVFDDQGLTVEQWQTNQAVSGKKEISFAFDFQRATFRIVDPPWAPPPVTSLIQIFPVDVRTKPVARGVIGTPIAFPSGTYDIVIQRDQKTVTWTKISLEGDVSVPLTDQAPAQILKNISLNPESQPAPETRAVSPESQAVPSPESQPVPLPPPEPKGPNGLPAPPNLTNVPFGTANLHGWFGCGLVPEDLK